MTARRPLVPLLLLVGLVTTACGGNAPRAARSALPGHSQGTVAAAVASTTSTTAAAGAPAVVAQPGGGIAVGRGGGPQPPGPPAPSAAPGAQQPADGARAALGTYLDAIAARDGQAVIGSSVGPALALAAVRLVVADVNAAAGATTTVHPQNESFQPASEAPDAVTFSGGTQLATDVSGPAGDQKSTNTIAGPVLVRLVDGAWRVQDFAYEGKPMSYWSENAQAVANGVHLTVAFVLSYGDATTALVGMAADAGQASVHLDAAGLVVSSGSASARQSGFGPGGRPTGFIAFPRTDEHPVRLEARFSAGDGSHPTFVIPLA